MSGLDQVFIRAYAKDATDTAPVEPPVPTPVERAAIAEAKPVLPPPPKPVETVVDHWYADAAYYRADEAVNKPEQPASGTPHLPVEAQGAQPVEQPAPEQTAAAEPVDDETKEVDAQEESAAPSPVQTYVGIGQVPTWVSVAETAAPAQQPMYIPPTLMPPPVEPAPPASQPQDPPAEATQAEAPAAPAPPKPKTTTVFGRVDGPHSSAVRAPHFSMSAPTAKSPALPPAEQSPPVQAAQSEATVVVDKATSEQSEEDEERAIISFEKAVAIPEEGEVAEPARTEESLNNEEVSTSAAASTTGANPTEALDNVPVEEEPAEQPFEEPTPEDDQHTVSEEEASTSETEDAEPAATIVEFNPAWEVKQIRWPNICQSLADSKEDLFGAVADCLSAVSDSGRKIVAVTSSESGVGCTTVTLSLAKQLATSKRRVLLVDANFQHPQIANELSLQLPRGWEDAIRGEAQLDDAAILSTADHLSILPLGKNSTGDDVDLSDPAVPELLQRASQCFDIVLIDIGPFQEQAIQAFDAALIVHDRRQTSMEDVTRIAERIQEAGAEALGVAENFAG